MILSPQYLSCGRTRIRRSQREPTFGNPDSDFKVANSIKTSQQPCTSLSQRMIMMYLRIYIYKYKYRDI